MLSGDEFIKQSLGLHLFFARIMKEHSFFLEVGFTPRDAGYTQQADDFRREFDGILEEAILLSDGVVNPEILKSGEIIIFEYKNKKNNKVLSLYAIFWCHHSFYQFHNS